MTIRAVVFDVGETLVDETRAWTAWADALKVPRLTFLATLGGVNARGGDHREVFEILRPDVETVLVNRFYLRGVEQIDKRTGVKAQRLPGQPLGGINWQDRS